MIDIIKSVCHPLGLKTLMVDGELEISTVVSNDLLAVYRPSTNSIGECGAMSGYTLGGRREADDVCAIEHTLARAAYAMNSRSRRLGDTIGQVESWLLLSRLCGEQPKFAVPA